jgi:hypothetical protein
MTENEKLTTDYLKWWLIILTIVSGLVWIGVILELTGVNQSCSKYLIEGINEFIGIDKNGFFLRSMYLLAVLGYVMTPLVLYLSWRFWRLDVKKKSKTLSIIQIILSISNFILLGTIGLFSLSCSLG